jgi:CDP-diacylglycerol--glycerol-3-phosphate 3-phosphatidyltransferase
MRFTIPNQLTILRIGLTPIFVILFVKEIPFSQFIASIVYLLASITDWYDGWFARRFGVITRWGQFMDPLADKFLVSSALIVFAWLRYTFWWMVLIIIVRDILITSIRIYTIYKGSPLVTSNLAKWKTFIQMTVILIILLFINYLNYYGSGSVNYQAQYLDFIGLLMFIVTIITIASGAIYIKENYRLIWSFLKKIFFISSR